MAHEDERIALLLDYENLAIGARDGLGVVPFDFGPVADALAERGRVVVRRAYADWSAFDEDRRLMARAQVELIEIPQRIGGSRKNAADIKLAVDAIELAYEREFVTTFAIATGDSDFTPLMHKLRELDKRVIGIGVQSSTSALLPPACDEFLFYDRLPGVEPSQAPAPARRRRGGRVPAAAAAPAPAAAPATGTTGPVGGSPSGTAAPTPAPERVPPQDPFDVSFSDGSAEETATTGAEERDVAALVVSTLTGLMRHADGPVLASRLKRAVLRKDPTFDEADHGFRGFGELLRHLEGQGAVTLTAGTAQGDPEIGIPDDPDADKDAFAQLVDVVRALSTQSAPPQLSGLKDQLRKRVPGFSEKRYGFGSFLSFAKAARARELIDMQWSDEAGDYVLTLPS
ncbi:NYN domain-containing protein [Pseudonocardia nantongensis]|uniref:NYN domain-containing protein n=1 Tax=Pseudonocardia nantongensis TaxID=1181885 RepID=UPI00397D38A0